MAGSHCTVVELHTWAEMLRANTIIDSRLDEALRRGSGISLAEYEVLAHIDGAGGRMLMGHIAENVILSKSGVTRIVSRLEDSGLVRREIPAENRRSTWAVLTEPGRERLGGATDIFEPALKRSFVDHLSGAELRQLSQIMKKLVAALK